MNARPKYSRASSAAALVAAVLLGGCAGDSQFADLDRLMAEDRERPKGQIEPLPTYPPAERFNYSALVLRSPFEPPAMIDAESDVVGKAASAPDQLRQKQPLELFSYSTLSMVGTLSKDQKTWALIDDGNGRVHRVTLGNFVGRNFGEITHIGDYELDILETVPDGKGGWINRPRTMGMNEE
ncbi:MAG: pilus assembly protein PilP [Porticoccaceae bacterium]